MTDTREPRPGGEVVVYEGPGGEVALDVRLGVLAAMRLEILREPGAIGRGMRPHVTCRILGLRPGLVSSSKANGGMKTR